VIVGLNPEWESEGFDRKDLKLPCGQDELIEAVASVNERTVVVVQAVSKLIFIPQTTTIIVMMLMIHVGLSNINALALKSLLSPLHLVPR
jgi:beta-glucosidase